MNGTCYIMCRDYEYNISYDQQSNGKSAITELKSKYFIALTNHNTKLQTVRFPLLIQQ